MTSSVSTTASRKFLSVTCKLADDAGTAASSKDNNKTTRRAMGLVRKPQAVPREEIQRRRWSRLPRGLCPSCPLPPSHQPNFASHGAAFRFLLDLTPSVVRSFFYLALQWRLCCGHSLCQRHSLPARCGQRSLQSVRQHAQLSPGRCSVRLVSPREPLLREGFDVSPPLLPLQA